MGDRREPVATMSMMNAIIGAIASRERKKQYYTTVLYPDLTQDNLSIQSVQINSIQSWDSPNDTMQMAVPTLGNGNLTPTIVYLTYNNWTAEQLQMGIPALGNGNLTVTIAYITYNDAVSENITTSVPTITGGTITVTIAFITYNNALEENITTTVPTIIGGTLS